MKNIQIKKMSLANIEGKLSIGEMENIMAGSGTVSNVISGACAAVTFSGLIGAIVLNNPVGYGVRGVCFVHTVGRGMDWW